MLGSTAAGVGYALLGVGLGALVRNQIGALIGGLLWVLFAEPILGHALPDVGKWTPADAASSLTNAVGVGVGGDVDPDAYLPMWMGGLLLLPTPSCSPSSPSSSPSNETRRDRRRVTFGTAPTGAARP